MGVIQTKSVTVGGKRYTVNMELYNGSMAVVADCKKRTITNKSFNDMAHYKMSSWHGVKSYAEALELMNSGWQEPLKELKAVINKAKTVERKRISIKNDIQGYAPIVPLAILGVPNAMINMTMRRIKSKVINLYYDSGVSSFVSANRILDNGKKILETVINLENSGYRVNLFNTQCYVSDGETDIDMLAVKVKSDNQPIDLKRICFPIAHPAMFRVIGFDWISKFPKGKYRSGYGQPLVTVTGKATAQELYGKLFNCTAVYVDGQELTGKNAEYLISEVKSR